MPTAWADFIEAYNHELSLLGSGLRVRVADKPWETGDLIVVDPQGRILGPMPASIEPVECAAIEALIKTAQTWATSTTPEQVRSFRSCQGDDDGPS